MCGIYGSTDTSKFEILDIVNKERGNFASGIFCTDGETFDIQKTEGSFNWDKIKLPGGYTYLGHNQAPTSTERKWKEHNSHPFEVASWVVAHNGVLTNFKKLKEAFIPDHPNIVDSSIIPALLDFHEESHKQCLTIEDEVANISEVLSMLEGTFGVWIVNLKTMNIYIARQGSTLFYDNNSFSSMKGEKYRKVKEGIIYRFTSKGCNKAGEFTVKSPFLMI